MASRSAQRSRRFADRHHIDLAYQGYEHLLADPEVDIVYIAAPHAQHHQLALAAVDAGKHVLLEKPFTVSLDQATEVAAAARARGVFATEAMWTWHLPHFDVLEQVISRGDLGNIRLATADVGWQIDQTGQNRLLDPEQAGGVSLDMGVYGYWFAQFAIGVPREIKVLGSPLREGLAWQTTAIAHYIHDGLTESPIHTLDDTISLMRTIDEVRRQLQVS